MNKNFSLPIIEKLKKFNYSFSILHEKPYVIRIERLFTPSECQYLISMAQNKLSNSTIVVDGKEITSDTRTSKSAYITKNGENPTSNAILHYLLTKVSKLMDLGFGYFEGLKIVNYQKGQEYQTHVDFFKTHTNFTKDVGDRRYTFFVYLNTLEEADGGTTSFPDLGIVSKPIAGDAVFWTNMSEDGDYYENTRHSGDPVLGNTEKWGMNIWIREKEYKV